MSNATEHSAGIALVREGGEGTHGEREVLLIRVRKDTWELPKGHLEEGETDRVAAIRELHEETGIQELSLLPEQLVPIGSLAYTIEPKSKGDSAIEKHVTYFASLIFAGDNVVFHRPSRTKEVRWVTATDVAKLAFASDDLRAIVERAYACELGA